MTPGDWAGFDQRQLNVDMSTRRNPNVVAVWVVKRRDVRVVPYLVTVLNAQDLLCRH